MQPTSFPSVESFRAFCENRGLSDAAGKTYRSGYRRMLRDLDFSSLSDPAVLAQYRVSMKQGTRNVFDTMYKLFVVFMAGQGVTLEEPPPMPRIRFAHPLMHDVLTLTGYLNVPQLASLTWGTVPEHALNDSIERALSRIYEFQTGRAAMTATSDTPLLPNHNGTSMHEWQVEYIVNSVHHESDHTIDRSAKRFTEALVYARVNGIFLRDYSTAYWNARPNLVRAAHHEEVVKELLSMVRGGHFVNLRRLLADKASKLAGPVCW
jgi:hypothetical protein